MNSQSAGSAPSDFDFILGTWRVHHRRLNERFVDCNEWTSFTGETTTRQILQGYGNIEDNLLHLPTGDVGAVALRSFNPANGQWAIWWLDGRSPHSLDVPVVGQFLDDVGVFIAKDALGEIPIIVRFTWNKNTGGNPNWEQAFSQDDGITWEVNWTMEFVRVAA